MKMNPLLHGIGALRGGINWMLFAGGCVASFVSSVALTEEYVESASPLINIAGPKAIAAASFLKGSCFYRWTNFSSGWASERRRKALDRSLRLVGIRLFRSASVF
jgi:hypothetical protein